MFVKDVGYGAYAIHIDEPSLFEQFVDLCEAYEYNWIFGDSMKDGMPTGLHAKLQTGNIMLYTRQSLAIAPAGALPGHNIFTIGTYETYLQNRERHEGREYVCLSEMEDFAKCSQAEDMSGCVTDLIAAFI